MQRKSGKRFARAGLPGILLLALGGCATYGARQVDVVFRTRNDAVAARVFVVPIERWKEILPRDTVQPYRPLDAAVFRARLERWRVTEGRTPVTKAVDPYRAYCVIEVDGAYQWADFNPMTQRAVTIEVEGRP